MADKKVKPAASTPIVDAGEQRLFVSYPFVGGKSLPVGPNPSGATPGEFWPESVTTPPNANPAAMRGYTRNAPYMEGLVSDPQAMFKEIISLTDTVSKDPNDVVSEYRLRILKQALRDIYNLQTDQPYNNEYRPSSALPVTPGSR